MENYRSRALIVALCLAVGGLHLVTGPHYRGPWPDFVNGYLIDILLPMCVYLLAQLGLRERFSLRNSRLLGAAGTLLIGFSVETLQGLGYPVFGSTFDPLDYVMYALGAGLGLALDLRVLEKWESPLR
jgi:hypothetical protein